MLPLDGQYEFIDRLVRQLKERRQWASHNRVSCFRVYDREDPGFPFLIDLYEDRLVWSVLTDRDFFQGGFHPHPKTLRAG